MFSTPHVREGDEIHLQFSIYGCFMLILRRQNQRFETLIQNGSKTPLIQAIVRSSEPEICHLNVVICDFAFMLPPESSNHDRKRTFLACVHAYFAKAF